MIVNSHAIAWIKDKQKGLIESVRNSFLNSEHRFCVRHLYNNFKTQHKGLQLKQNLWNAARASTIESFEEIMEKMKTYDIKAYQWLAEKDPKHWSRAYFSTFPKCDILLNNLCEVFNAVIVEARDQPIITCVDMIRRYISKRIVARYESASKWKHDIGPRVFKIMEKKKLASINSFPEYCGDMKFEVRTIKNEQLRVDVNARTCDCRRWQLTGLPCSHGIACILSRDLNPIDFVDKCYKKEFFLKSYETPMQPMPGPKLWKKTSANPPRPPADRRQPGRPKKARRKEPEEIRSQGSGTAKLRRTYIKMKCRVCGAANHNKAGCPNANKSNSTKSKNRTNTSSANTSSLEKATSWKRVAHDG